MRLKVFLPIIYFVLALLWVGIVSACTRTATVDVKPWTPGESMPTATLAWGEAASPYITNPRPAGAPLLSPTPDAPHRLPGMRTEAEEYVVQAGDTLGAIATAYNLSLDELAEANAIADVNILSVGQVLLIPVPEAVDTGPGFKIIPDSELVASPVTAYFDVADFVYAQDGYLIRHVEVLDGRELTGVQIVQLIAQDFSVNPRLLLAVLEFQSGWVTDANPKTETLEYPLGWKDANRKGLYKQLAWAANQFNLGFYQWRVNGVPSWVLADGTVVPIDPTINAGTAAVQHFFAQLYDYKIWEKTVGEQGFFVVYQELFGYSFDYALEPIVPADLEQPPMQLPFEPGVEWAFTGGPHGGWGEGSAWAALDFAPHLDELGCTPSDAWVVAAADGLIVRAADGAVVQDLDGDGQEQTGWTLLYMHIESRERVQPGIYLRAGERIGHPSCEGGVSNGTHMHIARRYNGEWIPADQVLPFVLDGWVSSGAGSYYDGYLTKGDVSIEAWDRWSDENILKR
jgi:murein DD-endopeptidase MepM/ murein hydrolase activator NlpD